MKVATHDGNFHADDVFAIAVLKLVYKNKLEVIRTRDPKIYNACDLRVDVGARYDPQTGNYDHHQTDGFGKRPNGIPYAAFGLIWKQFGLSICGGDESFSKIDRALVQGIDSADNGILTDRGGEKNSENLSPYIIVRFIAKLRPCWSEKQDYDKAFGKAVNFAVMVLRREIAHFSAAFKASDIVRAAIASAQDSRVIFLDRWCPYQYTIQCEGPEALFVIFHNRADGQWRVSSIATDRNFNYRKLLPAKWAGKTGEELSQITGVKDVIFCHRNLFVAGAKTKQAAMRLAELALE